MLKVRARCGEVVRPAKPAVSSLESLGKCCDKAASVEVVAADEWEIRAKRCKSRFCPTCAKWAGLALRRRLVPVLETFKGRKMITLTVDRLLFHGPQEAYEWVREHHGVGRLVRDLRRMGYVESGRYVCVLEFQDGGWPHWHLMLETSYIPQAVLQDVWGRLRPPGIEQVPGRPKFGIVDVRSPHFASGSHAANYATKYIIKEPKDGWPSWVLHFEGRVARYSVSRGFWPNAPKCKRRSVVDRVGVPHGDSCFCDDCRIGINSETGRLRKRTRTIGARCGDCGRGSILLRCRNEYDDNGACVRSWREYLGTSGRSLGEFIRRLGRDEGAVARGKLTVGRFELALIGREFMGVPEPVGHFNRAICQWVPF